MLRYLPLALTLLMAATATANAADPQLSGRASVVDGDTIEIHGERIRLVGFDAPESGQFCEKDGTAWRCGQSAALALSDFIGTATVQCASQGRDRYKRILASCQANGIDIGLWMVGNGHAVRFMDKAGAYKAAEEAARRNGTGLWGGRFDYPADWRKARRSGSS